MTTVAELFPRGLVVSCQALEHEPLHGSEIMARMALAAYQAGAIGIRANSPSDCAAIKAAVPLPLIGLYKRDVPGAEVYITPTFEFAKEIAEAGADVIAIEATDRTRPAGHDLATLIRRIHEELGKLVMADISTEAEAHTAAKLGADIVGTTMSGYTAYTEKTEGPDFVLVQKLVGALPVPVFAEGRYHSPADAARALELGCHAVVVGGAITRPQEIAGRFVEAVKRSLT